MKLIFAFLLLFGLNSCDLISEPRSEQVFVSTPESSPSNFETDDSSFLQIKIVNGNYETLFLKSTQIHKDINALDSFLQKNKTSLDKDKVVVAGYKQNGKLKDISDLLLKYQISKFRVID